MAARDALQLARAQGVREFRDSDGSLVTYKTDSEMAAALAAIDSQINHLSRGQSVRRIMFTTSKGL